MMVDLEMGVSESDRRMIEMHARLGSSISISLPVMVGTRR
jgi:hypothetical protein